MISNNYKELSFVFAAFLIMALSCYFYAGDLMKRQIDRLGHAEMLSYEMTLRSLIVAHEAALEYASAAVVTAMEREYDTPEDLQELLSSLNKLFKNQKELRKDFVSVYGYLQGNYLDGTDWIPGKFYDPKKAPWLRGAIVQNGLFHSKPYIDPRTGNAVISISQVVFDRRGESHGVLAVDFLLNRIAEMVLDYKLAGSGYGLLLDDSFKVLTSPDSGQIGLTIDQLPGFGHLRESMENQGGRGTELISQNEEKNIVFFSLLENGWHLLLIAPRNYYYSQAFRLMPVIFILALSLASILGFLLVRLSAAKKRSEDESRSKSYFLARMSHEIRTPLNAIIGLGELAIRRYGQPQGKNDLEEIRRAGYNLLAIANDILDLSKVESGRLEINPGPYKTAALLSDVLVLAKATLGDRDLELSVSADPDLPAELVGDETLVRQVIMNLMTNAIKYTAEGFIRLHLKGEPAGEDQIRLLFTIEDSGPGLKPEQTALIFDDFVRLDGQQTEGTGLGLPIARSFCRAMGGDISVTSEFGRGTAFLAEIRQTVASPGVLLGEFKPARPSPDQGPGRPAPFLVPDFRVLIVDDIATNLEVADGLLSLYQMRTTLALSGREAIEAARKNDYDLFFIDHMMPDMDGLATLKALRQINEATGAAPMIALTASALAGMREMFLDNGFDDYLTKPIEMKSLNELLERLVPPGRRVTAPDQPAARPFQEEALAAAPPLEGFDPVAGQNRLGGSAEKYRAVLAIFLRDLESRRPLLATEMDRDSLIINLHALKAALANIGALTLAAEAAVLEAAAKKNDQPTLAAELRPFKAGLDQLESVVRAGLKTEEPRDPSPGSLSAETLRELKAALKAQDIGRIDETCERLSRAAPGGSPARATLAAISDHILMTDYQEAEELVDQLLREAENE